MQLRYCNGSIPQKAVELLQQVLEQNPLHARAQGLLAEAYAACGDLPVAMRAYQRALETDLVKEPGWLARLSLGLGRVALDLKQTETALAALQEASQAAPDNPVCQRSWQEAVGLGGLSADTIRLHAN
jgi:cytochrome c-type biogenesis protein CcmH/NrfG